MGGSAPGPSAEGMRERLRSLGVPADGHLLVALSGGADSVVLLHLVRFGSGLTVTAAHFDHGMRPGSAADARWVAGLCRAWGIPLIQGRADPAPRSENEAREARYAFLRSAQAACGAGFLATAHHADDQAETVLFRMARGTGLAGLAGIPGTGPGGLIRPLLGWSRAELRRYARAHRLRWREDPTNRLSQPVRNRIRNRLLPRLEQGSPAIRGRLLRLAELAGEAEGLLEARVDRVLPGLVREAEAGVLLERARLTGYDWPTATRTLRRVLRRFGTVLDGPGTRTALQFIRSGPSGSALRLAGGRARIVLEFGWARVEAAEPAAEDLPVRVTGGSGEAAARVGGRVLRVSWRTGAGPGVDELEFDPRSAPLLVRGWVPGDRIRLPGGTRTLKKLFNQARVPWSRRSRTPVVCDAAGRVVWVVGVAAAAQPPLPSGPALILTIVDA